MAQEENINRRFCTLVIIKFRTHCGRVSDDKIAFVTVTLELMEHKRSLQSVEPVLISSLVYSQDSPRKRVGLTEDGPGQIQEVKAIQQTRRLLANARERTRVHTISAAFEALRKQVRSSIMTKTSLIRGHTLLTTLTPKHALDVN